MDVVNLILLQSYKAQEKKLVILPKIAHRIAVAMNGDSELSTQISQEIVHFIRPDL